MQSYRRQLLFRYSPALLQASGDQGNSQPSASPPVTSGSSAGSAALAARKASRLGFFKRRDADSQAWMMENFSKAETLPSGIKIYNLPPPAKSGDSNFELYKKSTSDFVSTVDPNTIVGVGLGAGFGSRPDRRLGWLRPRKQDHLTPLPPEEQEKQIMRQIHEDGMQNVPEAKTPQERKQQIERMLKYMKSYDGMTLSRQEHFLLADLDFEKDAILFGNDRDEFVANVEKLKEVILQYNRWERTDNGYLYGTWFCKFACIWLIVDSTQTYFRFRMLRDSLDEFCVMTTEEINALKDKRSLDFKRVEEELQHNPPNFAPVIDTITTEFKRVRAEERAREEAEVVERAKLQEALSAITPSFSDDSGTTVIVGPGEGEQQSSLVYLTPEEKRRAHPMDTTFESVVKAKEEAAARQRDMSVYLKGSLDSTAGANEGVTSGQPWYKKVWRKVFPSSSPEGHLSVPGSAVDNANVNYEVLSRTDYIKFSYAAAPTSIATVRSIRRILLPRSDDYTQIVREEMADYKRSKDAAESY